MESDNILAINIPNIISIGIMGAIFALAIGLISKAVSSARNAGG